MAKESQNSPQGAPNKGLTVQGDPVAWFEHMIRHQLIRKEITHMLSYAITFLIIAIIAGVLGFIGIAGLAAEIAKILFFVFLVLFVSSRWWRDVVLRYNPISGFDRLADVLRQAPSVEVITSTFVGHADGPFRRPYGIAKCDTSCFTLALCHLFRDNAVLFQLDRLILSLCNGGAYRPESGSGT